MKKSKPRGYRLPKRVRAGDYTAYLIGREAYWGTAHWAIFRKRKRVGTMYDGQSYGWGRPWYSLNALVWAGPIPDGCASPRSKHYGIHFDGSPETSHRACMEAFARAADRLITWRAEHGS